MRALRIVSVLLGVLVLLLTYANVERLAGQTAYGSRGLAVSLSEWTYTLDVAALIHDTYFPALTSGAGDVWYESSGMFTKERLRSELRQYDLFYANTHGQVGIFESGDHLVVFADEIAQWVDHPFKLVFSDACYNGADPSLAAAFGIHDGDVGRAFYGWVGQSRDDLYYKMFTMSVFDRLASADRGSLVSAVVESMTYWPLDTPWKIYGDPTLRFDPAAASLTPVPTWTATPTTAPSLTLTPSPTATPNGAATATAVALSTSIAAPTRTATPAPRSRSYLPGVVR